MPVPAGPIPVVGTPLDGIGEDVVGGDDEPVPFELHDVGDSATEGFHVAIAVRMVDFDELVEAAFGVGRAFPLLEDLVGCGDGGRLAIGP